VVVRVTERERESERARERVCEREWERKKVDVFLRVKMGAHDGTGK
jgi:hypothetical protein